MPNNDDVLIGLPNIQCPGCMFTMDTSGKQIEKFSKQQREEMERANYQNTCAVSSRKATRFDGEDSPSQMPEESFLVLSCGNYRCSQYNKIKVLRLPRLDAPSVKVTL